MGGNVNGMEVVDLKQWAMGQGWLSWRDREWSGGGCDGRDGSGCSGKNEQLN